MTKTRRTLAWLKRQFTLPKFSNTAHHVIAVTALLIIITVSADFWVTLIMAGVVYYSLGTARRRQGYEEGRNSLDNKLK